ncbi:hypothetical protein HDU76_001334, partial [Blyttiomyces sp. JEL0837]
ALTITPATYNPGDTITVTLTGAAPFTGFLMYAAPVGNAAARVGTWTIPAGMQNNAKVCAMSENADSSITHTAGQTYQPGMAFTFKAPATNMGDLAFNAIVVQKAPNSYAHFIINGADGKTTVKAAAAMAGGAYGGTPMVVTLCCGQPPVTIMPPTMTQVQVVTPCCGQKPITITPTMTQITQAVSMFSCTPPMTITKSLVNTITNTVTNTITMTQSLVNTVTTTQIVPQTTTKVIPTTLVTIRKCSRRTPLTTMTVPRMSTPVMTPTMTMMTNAVSMSASSTSCSLSLSSLSVSSLSAKSTMTNGAVYQPTQTAQQGTGYGVGAAQSPAAVYQPQANMMGGNSMGNTNNINLGM